MQSQNVQIKTQLYFGFLFFLTAFQLRVQNDDEREKKKCWASKIKNAILFVL